MLAPGGTLVTYGGMSKGARADALKTAGDAKLMRCSSLWLCVTEPVTLPTSLFIFRGLVARGFWLTEWTRAASAAQRVRFAWDADVLRRCDARCAMPSGCAMCECSNDSSARASQDEALDALVAAVQAGALAAPPVWEAPLADAAAALAAAAAGEQRGRKLLLRCS
jgi:NADPH:quinone reductase-like Zn-dependent oxidoreductase